MGFFFFLLVTATLLIRPAELLPELRSARLYEASILLCLACSLSQVLEQLTLRSLETRPITVGMFGLLMAVVLSHLSQGNTELAVEQGVVFLKIVVYYLLLVGNINSAARMRLFIVCLGVFSAVCVGIAVLQYYEVIKLPEPEPEIVLDELGRPKVVGAEKVVVVDKEYDPVVGQVVEFQRLRGVGIFSDPNDLCLLLTMGIFIALFSLTDASQGLLRFLWLVPLLLMLHALLLTYSRAGILSFFVGCAMLVGTRYGWRALALVGAPLVPLGMLAIGGRMASFSASEGTGQARVQIWSDALDQLRTAPLFGIGFNELGKYVGKTAHNSFMNAFAELGLFGGTLFFGTFFFAFVQLVRLLQDRAAVRDPELRRLLPFLLAILASFTVGIMTLSRTDTVTTYMLLGMVTAFGNLAAAGAPTLATRLDGRLLQRMALGSAGMLLALYMFVRVFRA
jgi:hypothetical protein